MNRPISMPKPQEDPTQWPTFTEAEISYLTRYFPKDKIDLVIALEEDYDNLPDDQGMKAVKLEKAMKSNLYYMPPPDTSVLFEGWEVGTNTAVYEALRLMLSRMAERDRSQLGREKTYWRYEYKKREWYTAEHPWSRGDNKSRPQIRIVCDTDGKPLSVQLTTWPGSDYSNDVLGLREININFDGTITSARTEIEDESLLTRLAELLTTLTDSIPSES